eukprot:s862_g7.t1
MTICTTSYKHSGCDRISSVLASSTHHLVLAGHWNAFYLVAGDSLARFGGHVFRFPDKEEATPRLTRTPCKKSRLQLLPALPSMQPDSNCRTDTTAHDASFRAICRRIESGR